MIKKKKNISILRSIGFLARMSNHIGRKTIKNRRKKKRKQLTISF